MNARIDTGQWQRLESLFEQAIGMDAAGQAALLQAAEGEDPQLARRLASLLAADARHHANTSVQSGHFLQHSLAAIDAHGAVSGDRVGPYVLREELGRGGMGVVFRAERADGQVQQQVALKIVKRALLDASGRERFLREREIVASFQHPSIARMLDVGQTADGSPYLAMELIRGQPITSYCDANRLSARERVAMFLRVCEAVQHAHANLVLHRDLKPSNVLVADDGLPKLIDFGIAKPLGIVAGDEEPTATAQRFFSPSNVAPEQLRGERVGVACDVYQLGTLLHELLCGTPVFPTSGITAGMFERQVREVPPETPSARAAKAGEAVVQARHVASAAALARELRGDLDAIVARALRKAPRERYGSVDQLADDLRRYLEGRTVSALRGRRWYRARKFVRRNALAVALSMAAVGTVALFVTALWVQAQRIARERDLAEQRAREVQQVARFEAQMIKQIDAAAAGRQLMDDMRAKFAADRIKAGVADPERSSQVATFASLLHHVNATDTARDLIDRTTLRPAVAAIDRQFGDQPLVAANLRQVLADSYFDLGMYEAALPLQRAALETRRRVLGEEHPDTIASRFAIGELLHNQGNARDAEPYLREALRESRRVNGEDSSQTLLNIAELGAVLDAEGKTAESGRYLREAESKLSRLVRQGKPVPQAVFSELVWVLVQEGKMSDAEQLARKALDRSRRDLGENQPGTLSAMHTLSRILFIEGKFDAAEPLIRDLMERNRRVLGEDHPDTLESMSNMAHLLVNTGKPAEAEPYLRQTLEGTRRSMGDRDMRTLAAIDDLGSFLVDEGKLDEAEPFVREAVELSRRAQGEHGSKTEIAIGDMGGWLLALHRFAEAETLLAPFEAESRSASTRSYELAHPLILLNLGRARTALRRFAAAEDDLLSAQSGFDNQPRMVRHRRKCAQAFVDLYTAWNLAEPGRGHDAKASEWKRKLDVLVTAAPAGVRR